MVVPTRRKTIHFMARELEVRNWLILSGEGE
jgi:hypothetical protein